MKKIDKRWLLFLVLVLMLAVGLPYLSLNQEASTTTSVEEGVNAQTMAIALVNEDEGASFNGDTLTFGDAFVRSLDNNDEHNWFVVSRGVAESGLNQNTYDMMIVIPNDFSDKALSIDSESPEQVVLNYRINASDDDGYVKAEAEKTASTILNEFNRRIIDVYFASIIGNLQDAQDNIEEIVDQQTQHTSTYNNNINNPLSNYTNQFGMIKDNTQVSRDGFSGFEDLLQDFEGRLIEGHNQNQGYLSELDGFASVKDANNSELLGFSDALFQFNVLLNNPDAEQNLEQLKRTNDLINYQLQNFAEGEYGENIVTEIGALKGYLNSAKNRVDTANNTLVDILDGLYEDVYEKVSTILIEILDVSKDYEKTLMGLFKVQNKVEHDNIIERISELPSLNPDDFEGLPEDTKKDIENVIAVTDKYKAEFEEVEIDERKIEDGLLINEYEKKIIRHLKREGVTISDTVLLPGSEKGTQVFKLNYLPDKYEVKNLKLKFSDDLIWDGAYPEDGIEWSINNTEDEFSVEVTLRLKEEVTSINILDPVQLGWELEQDGQNEVDEEDPEYSITFVPNNTLVASVSIKSEELNEEDQEIEKEEDKNPQEETESEEDDLKTNNDQDQTNKDSEHADDSIGSVKANNLDDPNEESSNNNLILEAEEEEEIEEPEVPEEPEITAVEIVNNRVKHKVTKPVSKMDKATKSLIAVVNNTVKPYQQLAVSFEDYFGRDLEELNTDSKLEKLAAENSLYRFFNDTDIKNIITDDMVGRVIEGIYEEIEGPLSNFQENIANFRDVVKEVTDEQLERIMEEIVTTKAEAQILNDNLGQMLEQVTNWRAHSTALLEIHGKIEANDGEEQAAIMTLNNEFQPLLSNSQSIAEQAQGNLSSADTVYQTLDTIDNQADTIEQSGANLVTQAGQLSSEMTEKMVEDQEFAANFTDVLSNSRVGERQNENLYNFLSNPVQTSNVGSMTSGSNFTPYFLVLTIFIVVLFTAYVISTLQQKRVGTDQFAHEKSLMGTNLPITIITAGIGALEGIAIGVISSNLLGISDGSMVLWIVLITTLITGMLLVATYLLRQLKMLGMFVLVIVMSMYLFLTNAFGAGIDGLGYLRDYSPLQYVERILLQAVTGNANYLLAMLVIGGLILIGALANLLVINRDGKGDLEDEGSKEVS